MNNPKPRDNSDRQRACHQFQQSLDHLHQLTVLKAHEQKRHHETSHFSALDWEEVGEELAAMVELGEDF